MKPRIVALAGLSGSGKTTLARTLSERLAAPVLSLDDYYLPLQEFSFEERTEMNFDAPELVDFELLAHHLDQLQQGEAVAVPIYDFSAFTRTGDVSWMRPAPIILLEGQLALYDERVVQHCELRVFLEVETDICLARRVVRDVAERGRTPDEVHWRFHTHVLPAYRRIQARSRMNATFELVFPYTVSEAAAEIEARLNRAETGRIRLAEKAI